MKKNGYAEKTIEIAVRRLKMIAKQANLDEPEKVKEYVAFQKIVQTPTKKHW